MEWLRHSVGRGKDRPERGPQSGFPAYTPRETRWNCVRRPGGKTPAEGFGIYAGLTEEPTPYRDHHRLHRRGAGRGSD